MHVSARKIHLFSKVKSSKERKKKKTERLLRDDEARRV